MQVRKGRRYPDVKKGYLCGRSPSNCGRVIHCGSIGIGQQAMCAQNRGRPVSQGRAYFHGSLLLGMQEQLM